MNVSPNEYNYLYVEAIGVNLMGLLVDYLGAERAREVKENPSLFDMMEIKVKSTIVMNESLMEDLEKYAREINEELHPIRIVDYRVTVKGVHIGAFYVCIATNKEGFKDIDDVFESGDPEVCIYVLSRRRGLPLSASVVSLN